MKLAQENILQELRCGANVSYVLSDSNLFFLTGFKVLQGLENNGFLRCVKTSLNGQIQLVYLTHSEHSELKSLKAMLNSLDASSFAVILRNWVAGIAHAKTVGFLHCPNIVTTIDHVYVDPKTYEVYMIYLPIMEFCAAEDTSEFETEFRASLVQLIDSTPGFRVGPVLTLRESLIDGSQTIEDIARGGNAGAVPGGETSGGGYGSGSSGGTNGYGYGGMSGEFYQPDRIPIIPNRGASGPTLTLDAIQHATPFHQIFQPRTTLIGRADPNAKADVLISNNPYISNPHCEISFENGSYYVTDKSSNGTFINGRRLQKYVKEQLCHGDELRLANSSFHVTIA